MSDRDPERSRQPIGSTKRGPHSPRPQPPSETSDVPSRRQAKPEFRDQRSEMKRSSRRRVQGFAQVSLGSGAEASTAKKERGADRRDRAEDAFVASACGPGAYREPRDPLPSGQDNRQRPQR